MMEGTRNMTKLMEWLSVLSAACAVWMSLVCGYVRASFIDHWMPVIYVSPLIFLVMFGVYAVTVVLYRVYTFNDCEDAAKELQEEIKEAKRELESMGLEL